MNKTASTTSKDFIRTIIDEHIRTNKYGGKVVTRFPPEPNGHLHIGHAKSICLNFGLAEEYNGTCHLRFDDTDPIKEEAFFEESIKDMVQWLGFNWGDHLYHASDYFDQLYDLAVQLIEQDKAYVCSLTLEEIRAYRGTVTEPGKDSPYRERSVEENLDLFARMKEGEFQDGEHVLRAKIDMASPNMKMRDPLLYRIRHVSHHRTGDKWCVYPLYDFAHCLSDSIEGITHSICTLEFENNRELYDWIIDELDMPSKPRQYEFARLNINYTVMSKRKIQELVKGGFVTGWDDPRLLTLAGLRHRGYTPESIRDFCVGVGIAKANSVVDMAQLEHAIRKDLNHKAPRVLAVLDPLKVVITNYPQEELLLEAPYYPEDIPKEEFRTVPFSREIYIERDDFMENPPKGYFRLSPGGEVRLRYAYVIRCDEVIKDEQGKVVELRCSYDQETPIGKNPADGRRIKGTIHWVSAAHALPIEVRVYDRLFTVENPGVGEHEDFLSYVNPDSLVTYENAWIEPSVKNIFKESHLQFERQGYFVADCKDSTSISSEKLVFNRTVSLKDSWAKKPQKAAVVAAPSSPPPQKKKVKLTSKEEEVVQSFLDKYDILKEYAILFAQDDALAEYFEEVVAVYDHPRLVANWVINELKGHWRETAPVSALYLAQLVRYIDEEIISSKIAKEVFAEMIATGKSPGEIIEEKGLRQITRAEEIEPIVDQLLADNPDVIEQIRAGRENRIGFLVGQVMKATNGKANPQVVNRLLADKLGISY